jgi:peptidoglycan hydrolase-like protein with peptidoglycan-binding domain
MKKYFSILFFAVLIMPSVVFASWWNPISWFEPTIQTSGNSASVSGSPATTSSSPTPASNGSLLPVSSQNGNLMPISSPIGNTVTTSPIPAINPQVGYPATTSTSPSGNLMPVSSPTGKLIPVALPTGASVLISPKPESNLGTPATTSPSPATNSQTGYSATTSPTYAPSSTCIITNTLMIGSSGDDVACLQLRIGLIPDGRFGPRTQIAVKAFQTNAGLTADGVVGSMSVKALEVSN